MYSSTTLVINMVINSSAVLLGIPGNFLIIMVYGTKQYRSTAHVLIMGLALADLCICLMRPLDILKLASMNGSDFRNDNDVACKLPKLLGTVFVHWSVYVMALIAIDRYFAVCRPHDRKITPYRAKMAVILTLITACLVNFSLGIIYNRVDIYDTENRYVGKVCSDSGPRWVKLARTIAANVFICVSLGIMVVLYLKVVIEVRRRTKVRPIGVASSPGMFTDAGSTVMTTPATITATNDLSNEASTANDDTVRAPGSTAGDGDRQSFSKFTAECTTGKAQPVIRATSGRGKTTKMLLLTTAIFVITYIPTMTFHLVPNHVLIRSYSGDNILFMVSSIFRILFVFNHVVNPFIYGFINKRFREDCGKLYRRVKFH